MENHLRKITVLIVLLGAAATLAAAAKRPFSHKYHLTQVPSCETCHTTATTSAKAEDNNLPDKSACVTCHDEVEIGEPHVTGVQKFNHAKHVPMGSIAPAIAAAVKNGTYTGSHPPTPAELDAAKDACSGCHRGILQSENVPQDKVVKAHFPHMADCLVCHNKINPPESCEKCHVATVPNFRPVSHTADFSDKHSDKTMDKTECASCHGRKFTCKGCH